MQNVWRQILRSDPATFTERTGSLDGIFQLANIAGPTIANEAIHSTRADFPLLCASLSGIFLQKVIHQKRNVLQALAQRWDFYRNDRQAVIKIFAKTAGFGFELKLFVG